MKGLFSMYKGASTANLLQMTVTMSNWTPYSIEYAVELWRRQKQCVKVML